MKKVQRINFDEGFEIVAQEAKNIAGEVTSKAIYTYKNNRKLIQGALLLNVAGSFIESKMLDSITDVANVITATKVAFDFVSTEVEEEEPASDKSTNSDK